MKGAKKHAIFVTLPENLIENFDSVMRKVISFKKFESQLENLKFSIKIYVEALFSAAVKAALSSLYC